MSECVNLLVEGMTHMTLYSVLYRFDGKGNNAYGVMTGQHGVREYQAADIQHAMAQFNESSLHVNTTVIAVVNGPFYNVSVMV